MSPALVTYMTLYLGMLRLPKIPLLRRGDYSYGLYLYGFPLQQAVRHGIPGGDLPPVNILVSMPLAIAVAMLSWHFVEAPVLRLKRKLGWLGAWETRVGGALRGLARPASRPAPSSSRPAATGVAAALNEDGAR